jgi:hypothetical protein
MLCDLSLVIQYLVRYLDNFRLHYINIKYLNKYVFQIVV